MPARFASPGDEGLRAAILAAWRTNSDTSAFLIRHLPEVVWSARIPGTPQRTIRSIAAHLHNARARWIRTLGREHGISVPALVDHHRITRRALLSSLKRSAKGIEALLVLGLESGGAIPPTKAYVWRNLPLDVGHVLTYFAAHEAHHRGQIVLAARQLGHRLPLAVTGGLWAWNQRVREATTRPRRKES